MINKFVRQPTNTPRLSKYAQHLLFLLNAQTHPDLTFRDWVDNPPADDVQKYMQELEVAGLVTYVNLIPNPTKLGIAYFNKTQAPANTDVESLIRQIKQALPRNPKFGVIVQGLTDTALIGLIYECFGEIGRRGDPEVPETFQYWQTKIDALKPIVLDGTPDTFWQHHQKQLVSFGTQDVTVPAKKTKTVKTVA